MEVRGVSPDLRMQVIVPNLAWNRGRQIARATQVRDAVPVHFDQMYGLYSFAVHDLLDNSADPDAETWDMEAEELPRLVRTFEILFAQILEAFAVEVCWDKAIKTCPVSRSEMLDIVRRGEIGTRVRYLVQATGD
jgi:hypothetical protein